MATTSYGTPMTMGSQPMTTTGLQAGVVRNMNLPLSRATPIQVTETTPNLEEIQGFPVAGRGLDGTHFHQDPITGQMYVMSSTLHDRIPQILSDRTSMSGGVATRMYDGIPTVSTQNGKNNTNILSNPIDYFNFSQKSAPNEPFLRINGESMPTSTISARSISSLFSIDSRYLNMSSNLRLFKVLDDTKSYPQTTTNSDLTQTSIFYTSPVNIFNNFTPSVSLTDTTYRFIPLNIFANVLISSNLSSFNNSQYIPINKFYNI